MDLTPYYQMVDNCIRNLGVEPNQCKTDKPGQWDLKKGSMSVWIDIFENKETGWGYFQCMGPICQIPATNKEAFYEELFEINHKLYGVSFTKYKDWMYLKTIREVEGLSEAEVAAMMNRIGNYGDDYDDYLKNKYFPVNNTPGQDKT